MTLKFTQKRTRILDTLKASKAALSAADIHQKLDDIDLVTIYRSLEIFTKEKLVKKFHFDGAEAKYEYQREPHHHAICSDCERVIHFKAPDKKIIKLLGLDDFEVDELEVIIRGRCVK